MGRKPPPDNPHYDEMEVRYEVLYEGYKRLGDEVPVVAYKNAGGEIFVALLDNDNVAYYTNIYRDEFSLDNKKIVELKSLEDCEDDYDMYVEGEMYKGLAEIAIGIF